MDKNAPLRSFRESPWRYSQFAVLALVIAALVKWLSPLAWAPSLVIGAILGLAYLLFEKRRGVI
jgi:Flp pilus assembly protein TadB